jgi:N-acetylmuramoyl-L-alanine amidase
MLSFNRSALLVVAALSASSVAPAQVTPGAEPLMAATSVATPPAVTEVPLDAPPELQAPAVEPPAEAPESAKPSGDLSDMVAALRGSDPGSRELECLAVGIYFEAKSEPLIGQLAVGEVIANRARSGRFAPTYCGVLFQRGQFSFIRGKSLPAVPRSSRQWQTAVAIAKIVDGEMRSSSVGNALFFHAKRVSPGWRLKRVASVGNHVFYR